MTNVLYIYFHVKFAKSSILVRQLTDLDFVGNNYKESERKFLIDEEIKQKAFYHIFLIKSYKGFVEDIDIWLID